MGLLKIDTKKHLISNLFDLASSYIRITMAIVFISYSYVGTNKKFNFLL
jgi:hypothetical protein